MLTGYSKYCLLSCVLPSVSFSGKAPPVYTQYFASDCPIRSSTRPASITGSLRDEPLKDDGVQLRWPNSEKKLEQDISVFRLQTNRKLKQLKSFCSHLISTKDDAFSITRAHPEAR